MPAALKRKASAAATPRSLPSSSAAAAASGPSTNGASSTPSAPSSSSSTGFKPFSSLRKSASQFFASLGANKGKRKAETRASTSSDQEESSGRAADVTPTKKRARIAAPDSLGKEESRRLVALLDQDRQPEYDSEFMDSLERDRVAAIVRPRILDPKEEMQDDAEIEDALGSVPQSRSTESSQIQSNGIGSSTNNGEQPRSPAQSKRARRLSKMSPAPLTDATNPEVQAASDAGVAMDMTNGIEAHDNASNGESHPRVDPENEDRVDPENVDKDSSDAVEIKEEAKPDPVVSQEVVTDAQPATSATSDEVVMNGDAMEGDGARTGDHSKPGEGSPVSRSPETQAEAIPKAAGEVTEISNGVDAEQGAVDQSSLETPYDAGNSDESVPSQNPLQGSLVNDTADVPPSAPAVSAVVAAEGVAPVVSGDALTEEVAPIETEVFISEQNGLMEEAPVSAEALPLSEGFRAPEPIDAIEVSQPALEGAAIRTDEIGAEEDVLLEDAQRSAQPVEIIDFTGAESSDEDDDPQEEILIPRASPGPSNFARQPSTGLLRGPLSNSNSGLAGASMVDHDATQLIRRMGRASLSGSRPAMHSSSMSSTNANCSDYSMSSNRPKRAHIREREHKQQLQARRSLLSPAPRSINSPLAKPSSVASPLQRTHHSALTDDPQSLQSYRQLLARTLGPSRTGPQPRPAAVGGFKPRETARQRNFELLLQKSRFAQSKITVPPSKELLRLRREEKERERRRRGILGRKPLPANLDAMQEGTVQQVLSDPRWSISMPGASASNRDVMMLRPGQWMNDETITFYMTMINLRSQDAEAQRAKPDHDKCWNAFYRVHAFNSHFWARVNSSGHSAVSRWTRKVDLFAKDLILVPCNLGNSHWTCAAINFRRRRIEYYDSMGGENYNVTTKLRDYLKQEMIDKKRQGAGGLNLDDIDDFEEYFAGTSSPQQRNGYDCGVFVCATLEQLSRRDPHFPFAEDPEPDEDDWEDDEGEGEDESDVADDGVSWARDGQQARRGAGAGGKRRQGDGYEWNFGQGNMPYMRRRIIYEISQKKLLD